VTDALDGMGATYLQTDETSARDGTVLYVPVPQGGAQPVLDGLYDAGLPEDSYAVITDGDTATGADLGLDELDDRYVEGPDGEAGLDHSSLRERAEEFARPPDVRRVRRTQRGRRGRWLTVELGDGHRGCDGDRALRRVVAVGGGRGDHLRPRDGRRQRRLTAAGPHRCAPRRGGDQPRHASQFVPPSLAIIRLDQVAAFITPSLLALAITIAAGTVGALTIATDLPTAITGIAVAAAIVPAAAAAGIGIVWGEPLVVVGAVILLVMNVVTINLAAYIALVALGYRSSIVAGARENLSFDLRMEAYTLAIVVFVLALATFGTYQYLTFEQSTNEEVQLTLDEDPYRSLELMSVSTSYTGDVFNVGGESAVTVTVGRSSNVEYPLLAPQLQTRIGAAINRPVTVQIRFVDYEQA
jgi:hypothetical protein